MEILNHQTIHDVWQRVQQKPAPADTPDWTPLIIGLRQEASILNALYKRTSRTAVQPLIKQVASHIACIKGMMNLSGQRPQDTPLPHIKNEPTSALLRRGYTNMLSRLTEYEKRTSDAAFGPVFHILAAETRSALRTLTELSAEM
jgi:hypothetical protein